MKFCWKAFDKGKHMITWNASHNFCSQRKGRLANSTDVKSIKKKSGLTKYWLDSAELKVFCQKDLLRGWYWTSDESELNASHGWLQNKKLRFTNRTFEKKRCAFIGYEKKRVYWKDDSCNSQKRTFICKSCRVRFKILFCCMVYSYLNSYMHYGRLLSFIQIVKTSVWSDKDKETG